MPAFGEAMRAAFMLESHVRFLNHGSFGAAPREVLEAAARWRRAMEANPDRFMRETLPAALRSAAARLAAYLRTRERDLVFVENATAGVNAVLRSLECRPGDEIVVTDHAYGAVRQAIRYVCARSGAILVEAPVPLPLRSAEILYAAVAERLNRRTKLLVIDHIELDLPALGADWYVGNCHKWLFAPRGCGFLWAHPDAQHGLHPLAISHRYGDSMSAEFDWTGTRDFSAWLAVPDALDFAESAARVHAHQLVVQAARRIAAAWNMQCDGSEALHASMMAIRIPPRMYEGEPASKPTAERLQREWLAKHAAAVAINPHSGALWLRLSGQIYNDRADYVSLEAL
ncbi:MAG: aminotransferase class V-fold PLP-dependent enzyme [Betaproteobacteria bacterium]